MNLEEFETLALEMWKRIPPGFKQGVSALVITHEPRFDPELTGVVLMGECATDEVMSLIPDAPLHSMIYVHHGSFAYSAEKEEEFPWAHELWETLTHELRHHLEWRAGVDHLGHDDDAERQDFRRRAGRPFATDYYRTGAEIDDGVYALEKLLFVECPIGPGEPDHTQIVMTWGGLLLAAGPIVLQGPGPWYHTADVRAQDDNIEVWIPWYEVILVLRPHPVRRRS